MTQLIVNKQGLKSIFWYRGQYSLFYYIAMTVLGAVLIAASAHIELPLSPVPVTLQTFVVVLFAMCMGWRSGLAATLSYLAAGMAGFPVFAGLPSGLAYLFGPTGGYLLAFPVVAFLAGWLAQHGAGKRLWRSFIVALVSLAIILAIGATYLADFVGVKQAFTVGFEPFMLGELLKAVMIAAIVPRVWRFAQ
jgi:biotin transport system substrate-specific component